MDDRELLNRARKGLREIAEAGYKEMTKIQPPFHRSLYYGGAGIGYMFRRAACRLEEAEWLHYARHWIDSARVTPEPEMGGEMSREAGPIEFRMEDSQFFGDRGISFSRALIAYSEDNLLDLKAALKDFTAPEVKRLDRQELFHGLSGRLVGTALLYWETGAEELKPYGDRLSEDLSETAFRPGECVPWEHNRLLGLSHGRAGNYYALFLWSHVSGYELPPWAVPSLRAYADSGIERGRGIGWPVNLEDQKPLFLNNWCHGAPGLVLLWTLAYRLTQEDIFRRAALAAGEFAAHEPPGPVGYLCCGAAGIAYGFLALHRLGLYSDDEWLEQAWRFAGPAWEKARESRWPLSLYKGLAGVICLYLDLLQPGKAHFPAVE